MTPPFLSIYTPTYRRPVQLAACMASVQAQTFAWGIEQIVHPDYRGIGVAGMFTRVATFQPALHGEYVTWLCDDDILAAPDAVEQLYRIVQANHRPAVLMVSTEKGEHGRLPTAYGTPVCGRVDLNCVVVRRDIWGEHLHALLPASYESDYQWIRSLWHGAPFHDATSLLLSRGAVSRGSAE